MSIELARSLNKENRSQEALDAAAGLAREQPANRFAHYEMGKALIKLDRLAEARAAFEAVLRIKPDWAGAHVLLGEALLSSGDHAGAEAHYVAGVRHWTGPSRQDYVKFFYSTCDNVFNKAPGDQKPPHIVRIVESMCDADISVNGETPWASLYKAVAEYAKGNFEQSVTWFEKVSIDPDISIGRHASGARGMRSVSHVKAVKRFPKTEYSHFDWLVKPKQGDCPYVTLISCDGGYFQKYAILSAKTIIEKTKALIHINIINPTVADFAEIKALEELAPGRFAATTQAALFNNFKCFCASSRFLILPELQETYTVPIITIDADSAVISDIPYEQMSANDICYKSAKRINLSHFPWRTVAAGILFFNTTPGARQFARAFRNFITSVFIPEDSSDHHWYIDQSAMICVMEAMRNHVSFHDLGSSTAKYCIFPDATKETKDQFVERFVNGSRA